jgi:hypothetical protein
VFDGIYGISADIIYEIIHVLLRCWLILANGLSVNYVTF